MRALVTDAEVRHSLAVIRSLGSQGYGVTACSKHPRCQGFFSRFCDTGVITPGPGSPGFVPAIKRELARQKSDVLLSGGDQSTLAISRSQDELSNLCSMAIPEPGTLTVAADKQRTLDLARKMDVPVPKTPRDGGPYPRVVKPRMGGRVLYVHDEEGLGRALEDTPSAIVQELVPGSTNYAVCALLDHGHPLAVFTHRELRELPPTGGSATVAESIGPNRVTRMGLRMLESVGWHGAAMVEFKHDERDGGFKLMEINPRFWASLELAIASGIDFPLLAARLATGEEIEPVEDYAIGVRFRWLAQDILHLSQRPGALPDFLGDFFDPCMRYEVRVDDLKPHIFEISNSIAWSVKGALGYRVNPRIA